MKVEIERRFLLKAYPKNLNEFEALVIRQDYLVGGGRIRASFNTKNPGKIDYIQCSKKRLSKMSSEEDEIDLTHDEYSALLSNCNKSLRKTRILIPSGDLTFELDIFHDPLCMAILEIELPTEDTEFEIPEFLKDFVICEITGDSKFSNFNLAIPHTSTESTSLNVNRTFKIVSIHPHTNRQYKKRVYTSEADYLRYKDDIIKRYKRGYYVKCYELINGDWKLIDSAEYEGGYYLHKKYEEKSN